jgi:hypothetical protein
VILRKQAEPGYRLGVLYPRAFSRRASQIGSTLHIAPKCQERFGKFVARIWESTRPAELKVNTELEAIQVEMRQKLKDGKKRGETELETTSRLVWLERQRLFAMCHAMEEVMRGAEAALDLEREISRKGGVLLRWYKPLR